MLYFLGNKGCIFDTLAGSEENKSCRPYSDTKVVTCSEKPKLHVMKLPLLSWNLIWNPLEENLKELAFTRPFLILHLSWQFLPYWKTERFSFFMTMPVFMGYHPRTQPCFSEKTHCLTASIMSFQISLNFLKKLLSTDLCCRMSLYPSFLFSSRITCAFIYSV